MAVGKTGRGGGAGLGDHQWVKSGDWELEDQFCCFYSKLKWAKVCSS